MFVVHVLAVFVCAAVTISQNNAFYDNFRIDTICFDQSESKNFRQVKRQLDESDT